MKTKKIYLILISIVITFSANAQLEGKKFQTIVENIGEINLEFKDNVYELSTSANVVVVKGNNEIKEKTITFADIEGSMACQREITGKYEFEYVSEELKLKTIEDACSGRKNMASTIWKELKTN